jgi:hypothetical protein
MTEHEPKEREQDNAVREQCEVTRAFEVQLCRLHELGAYHRRGEPRGGVREEERGEGVSDRLEGERKVRAEEEEEMRWEREERGEEKHAQGGCGVDSPAELDAHVLDFGHRRLGPVDEGRFRAGGGGEGDGGWKDGGIGVAVRGQCGERSLVLCKLCVKRNSKRHTRISFLALNGQSS